MEVVKWKGHKIVMHTSLDMPIDRFMAFNKNVLIDAGIGSDLESFDQHLATLLKTAKQGLSEQHRQGLLNMRQNVAFVVSNLSPRMLAFAALVESIDGKPTNDLSDEGLKRVVDMLAVRKFSIALLGSWVGTVKKKLRRRWRFSFQRTQPPVKKRSSLQP